MSTPQEINRITNVQLGVETKSKYPMSIEFEDVVMHINYNSIIDNDFLLPFIGKRVRVTVESLEE